MKDSAEKNQITLDYTFILDASGSMSNEIHEILTELNRQLKELKATHKKTKRPCNITIIKFNSRYEILRKVEPVEDIKPISASEYFAAGMTALYDALGLTLNQTYKRIGQEISDCKNQALLVFFTDGRENASKEYSGDNICTLLEKYQNLAGWQIAFIGTDSQGITDIYKKNFSNDKVFSFNQNQKITAMRNITTSVNAYYSLGLESFSLTK